jgi:restriction endonuclease S subunit
VIKVAKDYKESFSDKKTPGFNILEWKEFKLTDLFDLENGKGYLSSEALENPGDNPFVCSSETNNGVACFTSLTNTHDGNCLTINKDGSVGCAFYQEKAFSTNKHVIVATPKFEEFNKYIAMFLIPIIELEKFRYSFGRAWGLDRMKTTIIKLPVNESGEPNYKFMEDYIKTLQYSICSQIKEGANKLIEYTRNF